MKQVKVWDLPLRLFHWTLVLAIAVAFLSSEEDSPINQWHMLAGWIAGILIVFRLVWGFVGAEHSRFADFVRPSKVLEHLASLVRRNSEPSLGHNPLGGVAVVILLALTGVTVWTGAFGGESAEDLHELVAWTLLAMIGVHLLAVLVMSVLGRENLVRAMISGTKPTERHPGARDARSPRPAAILLAFLVILATVFGVLRYDGKAFTLRTTEAAERDAGAANRPSAIEVDRD
jgi:cytochrome b